MKILSKQLVMSNLIFVLTCLQIFLGSSWPVLFKKQKTNFCFLTGDDFRSQQYYADFFVNQIGDINAFQTDEIREIKRNFNLSDLIICAYASVQMINIKLMMTSPHPIRVTNWNRLKPFYTYLHSKFPKFFCDCEDFTIHQTVGNGMDVKVLRPGLRLLYDFYSTRLGTASISEIRKNFESGFNSNRLGELADKIQQALENDGVIKVPSKHGTKVIRKLIGAKAKEVRKPSIPDESDSESDVSKPQRRNKRKGSPKQKSVKKKSRTSSGKSQVNNSDDDVVEIGIFLNKLFTL